MLSSDFLWNIGKERGEHIAEHGSQKRVHRHPCQNGKKQACALLLSERSVTYRRLDFCPCRREFIDDEPISNWEFVAELHCHRFGGIIHNLRAEGYEITTLPTKKRGLVRYYCTKLPTKKAATIS